MRTDRGTIIKWSSKVDGDFTKAPISALRELSKGSALSVYLWLLYLEYDLRNNDKVLGGSLVTWDVLCDKCGISRSTLARRLDELEVQGFIHREKQYTGGENKIASLSTINVIVKPSLAQQYKEYEAEMVAQEQERACAVSNDDFGADDFGAENMIEDVSAPTPPNDMVSSDGDKVVSIEEALTMCVSRLGRGQHIMDAYNRLFAIVLKRDIRVSDVLTLCDDIRAQDTEDITGSL